MSLASLPILPQRLSPGDTVAVIAPSSPFDHAKFQEGVAVLEAMGLRPSISEGIYEKKGYLAGTDAHRARLVHECFADPAMKGVFCARGGYGTLRLLPLLDFDLIAANPKIFMGYSDVSVLLNVFCSRCGFVTFHGPMMKSLAQATQPTRQAFMDCLFTGRPVTVFPGQKVTIRSGAASGIVSGGNLATLCHLVGTPYQIDFSGHIVLLEDIGEPPYRIDRMLTQMRMAGCFEGAVGLALGSFKGCGSLDQIYAIVDDVFLGDPIPILAGFEIGHDEPNLAIPFGIRAVLDADAGCLRYEAPGVAG